MSETSPARSAQDLGIDPEVYQKYLRNLRSGRRTHAQGNYIPLTKNPSDIPNGITLRAFFTKETNLALTERLIRPIQELATVNGIPIYSGVLWTPHTTISNLLYLPEITLGSKEEAFEKVSKDQRTIKAAHKLEGLMVNFDVLFGGNAIALAASLIPTQILEARRQMTQVAKNLGMGENDYTNILHISLARMAEDKQLFASKDPNSFGRELMKLHHSLVKQPLSVQINHTEIMPDLQMIEIHEAPLTRALRIARNES